MTAEKFRKWRKSIADQLIAAYTHYHIWEQLWPTEESVKVLNWFKVFFHYTIGSHSQLFLLSIAKITEHRNDSVNLWRMLDEVERNPSLVPQLSIPEIRELRERLEAHNDLLGRIRTHRDKRIAHVDSRHSWPDSRIWQDNVVTIGEAKKLLQDLEGIFNRLSVAHDGHRWSLKHTRLQDTSMMLKALVDQEITMRLKSENAIARSRSDAPK